MNELKKLKEKIKEIEITYNYEETYYKLYNTCIEYDMQLDEIFNDFIDYELAEERAKYELEHGGLERLKYYLNDTIIFGQELFKLDGYGNLYNIHKEDLKLLKEEILEYIDYKLK